MNHLEKCVEKHPFIIIPGKNVTVIIYDETFCIYKELI